MRSESSFPLLALLRHPYRLHIPFPSQCLRSPHLIARASGMSPGIDMYSSKHFLLPSHPRHLPHPDIFNTLAVFKRTYLTATLARECRQGIRIWISVSFHSLITPYRHIFQSRYAFFQCSICTKFNSDEQMGCWRCLHAQQ